jgi:hypothetical protein
MKDPVLPVRRWREEKGVIYFQLFSEGTSGQKWVKRLRKRGCLLSAAAISVLRSPMFRPTGSGIINIAVLRGTLFPNNYRYASYIRAQAQRRKLWEPGDDIACLIREAFSDKEIQEMGCSSIVGMGEPIDNSNNDPTLLLAQELNGCRWLRTCYGAPHRRFSYTLGFAFIDP